jgi:Protein of unknown function (DUF1573)
MNSTIRIWLLITGVAVCGCAERSNRLTVEPAEIAIQHIDGSEKEIVVATIRNESDRSIMITGIRVSCSCVVPTMPEENSLAASESVAIELVVTPPSMGDTEVIVEFETDDSDLETGKLKLVISGADIIVPRIMFRTRGVQLTGRIPGEDVSGEFQVRTWERKGDSAWVTGVASSSDQVLVDSIRSRKNTQSIRM